MRRLTPAIAIAALVVAGLAACAPVSTVAGCGGFTSGDASSAVTADGDVGEQPEVDFPTPLISDGDQLTQLVQGDGRRVQPGDYAAIGIMVLLGEDGQTVQAGGYDEFVPLKSGRDTAISRALSCATVGSRFVLTTTPDGGFGDGTAERTGLADDATLVVVIDVDRTFLGKADGQNQLQVAGLPSVVTAVDGRPGIVLPGTDAPTEHTTALVKAGAGRTVEDDDQVLVEYSQFSWGDTATQTASTWDLEDTNTYGPKLVVAGAEDSGDSPTGPFAADLSGLKIGSQLLVVVPGASADALAQVYVIDLLGVVEQ